VFVRHLIVEIEMDVMMATVHLVARSEAI